LLALAEDAAARDAHPAVSGFKVGAALVGATTGTVYLGGNWEIAGPSIAQTIHAEQAAFIIHHWDGAEAVLDHLAINGEEGLRRFRGEHILPANRGGGGAHIEEQLGSFHACGVQHPVRAHAHLSAARSHGVHLPHIPQKRRITDGGADGVGIRVSMPDDENGVRGAHGRSAKGVEWYCGLRTR
jgi:hypothetical protein